jgi:hypothetical protein
MSEKRKNNRLELTSQIIINRLDGLEEEKIKIGIEVMDVSKSGVGFKCTEPLQIGSVYEAYLTIWTKEIIHAFIEIVRIEKINDVFLYGGIFIGMPELDAQRIAIYETINKYDKNN